MEINKKPLPITTLFGWKLNIDTNPDYQRPAVWSISQKQLLMDTILRGYDIPKIYLRQIEKKPQKFEVIDGQQRIRAIWSFMLGEFKLSKNSDKIDGEEISNMLYSELPLNIRSNFDIYPLDLIIISDTPEDEVREMFLRLQNGTTLKAQEKRNAMPGNMRNFIKDLVNHKFFTSSIAFTNSRFTHDHVAAQITKLELEGMIVNLKDKDLTKMYSENSDFDSNGIKAKKIRKTLDFLFLIFPDKTPELERYNVISLYALISMLIDKYNLKGKESDLHNWFLEFEKNRKEQDELPDDQIDPEIIAYHEKISHSTDAIDSLKYRNDYLLRKLFESIPDLELKDINRTFTHEQRIAIFRKDSGICQVKIKCKGEKCDWDNWHADHIIPWSKGGKTIVSNGQVSCQKCNLSKSDTIISNGV